ncbi:MULTISPECIES: AI-2E family transporter [Alteromonadaceae]|jgi:putative permease|uniref:AI-2E family transporter n=1 Tax=Brumicola blandensis TaxID=3075611 RepID=A0AAW8R2N0_9ALTE|nr:MULTISPECIES: AI-2E family transporter [unclassified Alteromonas]MDT0581398.1 AI-2E family transporter [Alteromonas sp. W409]MDT0627026.1 AI-2E family transporter [Alteromonas sp. W364]
MFGVFDRWYKRKFSDPNAMMLLLLIIISTVVLLVWGGILMPVIVAAIIAYLLDWPVTRLNRRGMNRTLATALTLVVFILVSILLLVGLVPVISKQSVNLAQELPLIWDSGQRWLTSLPEKYPDLIQVDYIKNTMDSVNEHLVDLGQQVISVSVSSIGNLAALLIYMILVPLMVFFMLKDKQIFLQSISNILPKERRLITQVGEEMNLQIANYIRGKVIEIIIVGGVSSAAFAFMDLRYSLLLGVLVGFSVLIPYIGAAVVTIPVAIVALFQFGLSSEFGYLMLVYAIIQALDGNLLVPVLFSEAVSLHPLYIIIAVLVFGGMWGFWGVFFAIPLATLVKAVITAWSTPVPEQVDEETPLA